MVSLVSACSLDGIELGAQFLYLCSQIVASGDSTNQLHLGGKACIRFGCRRRQIALKLQAQLGELGIFTFNGQLVLRFTDQCIGGDLSRMLQFDFEALDLSLTLRQRHLGLISVLGNRGQLCTQYVTIRFDLFIHIEQHGHVAVGLSKVVAKIGRCFIRELSCPASQGGRDGIGNIDLKRGGWLHRAGPPCSEMLMDSGNGVDTTGVPRSINRHRQAITRQVFGLERNIVDSNFLTWHV